MTVQLQDGLAPGKRIVETRSKSHWTALPENSCFPFSIRTGVSIARKPRQNSPATRCMASLMPGRRSWEPAPAISRTRFLSSRSNHSNKGTAPQTEHFRPSSVIVHFRLPQFRQGVEPGWTFNHSAGDGTETIPVSEAVHQTPTTAIRQNTKHEITFKTKLMPSGLFIWESPKGFDSPINVNRQEPDFN